VPSPPVAQDGDGAPSQPVTGALKKRVIPNPPEMDPARGGKTLLFVVILLLVAALVVGAVVAFNAFADPYGSLGTHILPTMTTSDRTVKADGRH
jgi:hypothetical protein